MDLVHTNDLAALPTLLFHLTTHLLQYKLARCRGRSAELHLFGKTEADNQTSGLMSAWFAKGDTNPVTTLVSCRSCRRWPAIESQTPSRAQTWKATGSRRCSTRTTRSAPPASSTSAPPKHSAGRPTRSKCHINLVILDSNWEAEFCRVAEEHPRVRAYVKNHSLGFTVPYKHGSANRMYIPDFIVQVDDGRGGDDLLNLVVEIKGYRGEDAKEKKTTMETYWVPGV